MGDCRLWSGSPQVQHWRGFLWGRGGWHHGVGVRDPPGLRKSPGDTLTNFPREVRQPRQGNPLEV